MDEKTTAARTSALHFLKDHGAGVIATAGHDNEPHAAAVYYVADDSFNIYFLTKDTSRKFAALKAHPQVAFVVGAVDAPQTLQIEGVATELTNAEDIAAHAPGLMQKLETGNPYHIPLAKMDDARMTVIWIQPKWIRWGDFSKFELGNESIFTEIPTE